jgi:hypothetical protein
MKAITRRKMLAACIPALAGAVPEIAGAGAPPLAVHPEWELRTADDTGRASEGEWWTLWLVRGKPAGVCEYYRRTPFSAQVFTWKESGPSRPWTIQCLGFTREYQGSTIGAKREAVKFIKSVIASLAEAVGSLDRPNGLREL